MPSANAMLPVIVACRPVDDTRLRDLCRKSGVPVTLIPDKHPGSAEMECEYCGLPMWLGPKQQTMRDGTTKANFICFLCVLLSISLGNALSQQDE